MQSHPAASALEAPLGPVSRIERPASNQARRPSRSVARSLQRILQKTLRWIGPLIYELASLLRLGFRDRLPRLVQLIEAIKNTLCLGA